MFCKIKTQPQLSILVFLLPSPPMFSVPFHTKFCIYDICFRDNYRKVLSTFNDSMPLLHVEPNPSLTHTSVALHPPETCILL